MTTSNTFDKQPNQKKHVRMAQFMNILLLAQWHFGDYFDCFLRPKNPGFIILCTPDDNPGGDWPNVWQSGIIATPTPSEHVASVSVSWDTETKVINHINLTTHAYALHEHFPEKYVSSDVLVRHGHKSIHNLTGDIFWAKQKIELLFSMLDLPCPPIVVDGVSVGRQMRTCVVWKPIPSFKDGFKKPWHAPYLEVHLMGIERSMFRDDLTSDRYNWADGVETMYRNMGLVVEFGLN